MKEWLKRLRAAIGVGLTWSAVWALSGVVIATIMGWGTDFMFEMMVLFATQDAIHGFIGGLVFAAMLRLMAGRLRFDQLSLSQFAAWGALGGFLIGAGWAGLVLSFYDWGLDFVVARSVTISTFLGWGTAAGSLAIARAVDDRELLEEGEATAEVGLSADEKRQLLG